MSSRPSGKRRLAEAIFKIGAMRFGGFTLASGKPSSYYLDLRTVPSHPDAYAIVIDAYRERIEGIGESAFEVLAGVATAGVTMSSPLAFVMKKPMVYVRKEEKGHGLGRLVEGTVKEGSRALLVDDVATTGGSMVSAVAALRESGFVVENAVVLVDRLEGASRSLNSAGVRLTSVVNVKELAEELYGLGLIGKEDYDAIMRQTDNAGQLSEMGFKKS